MFDCGARRSALFHECPFKFRFTRARTKEEYDNEAGYYDEIEISRMYGIANYDDGISRHKISKDETVYAVFTPIEEKETHVIGNHDESENEANEPPVSEDYLEPIEVDGGIREPPVPEIYLDPI